jgi:four helix bundle protein
LKSIEGTNSKFEDPNSKQYRNPKFKFGNLSTVRYEVEGTMLPARNQNSENPSPKQYRNPNVPKPKRYDLEDRTFAFAKRVVRFVGTLPKTIANNEISSQLVRASSSVGANYIEANESLGKKDFAMHIKISRKESKESRYWMQLATCSPQEEQERLELVQEAVELMKIFGAILQKTA